MVSLYFLGIGSVGPRGLPGDRGPPGEIPLGKLLPLWKLPSIQVRPKLYSKLLQKYFTDSDVDECAIGLHGCQHLCVNTYLSYVCTCYDGYRLQRDQRSCAGDPF